jgi:hypothetical protein
MLAANIQDGWETLNEVISVKLQPLYGLYCPQGTEFRKNAFNVRQYVNNEV